MRVIDAPRTVIVIDTLEEAIALHKVICYALHAPNEGLDLTHEEADALKEIYDLVL